MHNGINEEEEMLEDLQVGKWLWLFEMQRYSRADKTKV